MRHSAVEPIFENRFDAGRQLAERLAEYAGKSAVVLGIPNGGAAVALAVALALNADLDLVISRKIPLPLNPESGFGSVTDDGTLILNEALVKQAGLTDQQINYQVSQVRSNIRSRSLLYHGDRPPLTIAGRTVIIVDDGLASGYTMRAAIASVRHRKPEKIIAAAPVGPEHVVKELKEAADRVVTCAIGTGRVFAVADYYRTWYDVTEDEVLQYLREWRMRRAGPRIEIPERKQETV
ncbi:MAG TPA: phosphoribosyltransferase family protein [Dehalococcoidales bacterium]|nr:MAG: phosphoribosyl transferase [Chloroflexi bacterium RBG_16_60_22]HJX12898.1 phosphoribosyltransferase family protein [Dehalococcoidales bacterium]